MYLKLFKKLFNDLCYIISTFKLVFGKYTEYFQLIKYTYVIIYFYLLKNNDSHEISSEYNPF